ncbi:MAG: hypothetical protein GY696_27650, partial [Gammaproteobacteria bacterium]|nr:hypothetical protein [Gammaproteobacteria bacterium]
KSSRLKPPNSNLCKSSRLKPPNSNFCKSIRLKPPHNSHSKSRRFHLRSIKCHVNLCQLHSSNKLLNDFQYNRAHPGRLEVEAEEVGVISRDSQAQNVGSAALDIIGIRIVLW